MIKQLSYKDFFASYKPYWEKVYEQNTTDSPTLSTLGFVKREIAPYWLFCDKSFEKYKASLRRDFSSVPEIHRIGFNGPHLFLINAAPLCRFHSMLLPYFNDKLPQHISSQDQLKPAIDLLKEADTIDTKIFFNSEGAGSSINHLHYHILVGKEFINNDKIPIENIETGTLLKHSVPGVKVYKQNSNPFIISHFVVKKDKDCEGEIDKVAYKLIEAIKQNNKRYNLIIVDKGECIYVIPRNEAKPGLFGVGSMECSGVLLCREEKLFSEATQKDVMAHLSSIRIKDTELDEVENSFASLI